MARHCPECSTEMRMETIRDVQLDVCPKCGGIWFDAEELRTLLARDEMALIELEEDEAPQIEQRSAGASLRHCPDSYLPLEKYHYLYTSPIVLDACPDCGGFFVEADELGKMEQWLEQSHKQMSKDEEDKLAIAQFTIAHDNEMIRQRNLQNFFGMLRRYRPGWIGLVP